MNYFQIKGREAHKSINPSSKLSNNYIYQEMIEKERHTVKSVLGGPHIKQTPCIKQTPASVKINFSSLIFCKMYLY